MDTLSHSAWTTRRPSFPRLLCALLPLFIVMTGISQCDADGDGYPSGEDCDDNDPYVNPGADEVCDDIDNNCNGVIDEEPDDDGDNWSICNGDCDDTDPTVYPYALDICDGIDNDCDGSVDEDGDRDYDEDGYILCDDCDDGNAMVYPGANEICDDQDNNCDGLVDEDNVCDNPVFSVTFEVVVPLETPIGDTVYLTGDLEELGVWDPAGVSMFWEGGLVWSTTLPIPEYAEFSYKYTRGSWESVEKEADGSEVPDRYGFAEGNITLEDTVAKWADLEPVPPPPVGHLVINEVDYDNIDSDEDEFIEIYNPTESEVVLQDLALVLINGNGYTEYRRVPLEDALPLLPGEYLVAVSESTLPAVDPAAQTILFEVPANNVQNGAPDGIALMNVVTGEVIDVISYEGEIAEAVVELADGTSTTFSLVEGEATPVKDSNSEVGSLIRYPNANDTDYAIAEWNFTTTLTPGSSNVFTR